MWWGRWKYWKRVFAALAAVAAIATAGAAVVGVVMGLAQFEEANKLQEESNRLRRAELDSHFEEVMMGLDRHFVAYPKLRELFYSAGARSLPQRGPLRAQALGTAELIIDFADDIAAYTRMRKMARPSVKRWTQIVRSYFAESPAVRFAWSDFHKAYDKSTACILGAPFGSDEVSEWRWDLNFPAASWPRTCQ